MSPRPKRYRYVQRPPHLKGFGPIGNSANTGEPLILNFDEYEAIKLADYDKLTQEQASLKMKISRPTFTRIYDSALKKIACSFIEMRSIIIKGGNVSFSDDWYYCDDCKETFKAIKNSLDIKNCPWCHSENIKHLYEEEEGKDRMTGKVKRKTESKGFCVCPICKIKVKHHLGLPCRMTFCPECGIKMTRKYTFRDKNRIENS
ncbi:DUF134 domain-containing protein [candidate division KSB1 bacterium]